MTASVGLPAISVVIPAHNAASHLAACLDAIARSEVTPFECIVVDDASSDNTAETARSRNATVVRTHDCRGPAAARNTGARMATGALLLFLDSDVVVSPDTIQLVAEAFHNDAELDALMGCYDDAPAAGNFTSQFEGLHHHYMHQTAGVEARGLAGFCSAVKREIFLRAGGFDERYSRPSIEDVELGLRLSQQGRKLRLMKHVRVKHLKRWSLVGLVRAEVLTRAVPWARLMLRSGTLGNDLNLAALQKLSAALALFTSIALPIGTLGRSPALITMAAAGLLLFVACNWGFHGFLYSRRGTWFFVPSGAIWLLAGNSIRGEFACRQAYCCVLTRGSELVGAG